MKEGPVLGAVLLAIGGIIGSLLTLYTTHRAKMIYEEYVRKEEMYVELIKSLRGFYSGSPDSELKTKFLEKLDLCWVYCPDDIIHKAYNFIHTVHISEKHSDDDREKAAQELMLAMRKDLLSRKLTTKTELEPEDFGILMTINEDHKT